MTLLVVCPDYASHAFGLIEIASAARRRGHEVTFATGDAVRPLVEAAGLTWAPLRLGRGSNPGTIRVEHQPVGEDAHLQAFFDATRAGAVATLEYQADARHHDLLFEPDRVLDDIADLVDRVQPDQVLVDHISFGATLALYALDVPYVSVVLGHPTALPAPGELYGLPPVWPDVLRPPPQELEALTRRCAEVSDEFTRTANSLLARRAPTRPTIDDAFARTGRGTFYNYPADLCLPDRPLPEGSVMLGSLARPEALDGRPLPTGDGPNVYVSLGSFLGARDDVLRTVVTAARTDGWALALAHGTTSRSALGALPPGAVVEPSLPQVAMIDHADVVVSHGGNNTVTEALRAGRPLVVLPLSTDQFAGAAAIEQAGLGVVLDPNRLTAEDLRGAVDSVMTTGCLERATSLGERLSTRPGGELAAAALFS